MEGEGLAEVVVSPQGEALDPLVDLAGGRQHEDASRGAVGGQGPAHVVTVHDRQVAVEHDDLVGVDCGLLERGGPVMSQVDGHSLAPQAPGDGVGQIGLIFHHQHPHLVLLFVSGGSDAA